MSKETREDLEEQAQAAFKRVSQATKQELTQTSGEYNDSVCAALQWRVYGKPAGLQVKANE